MIDTLFLEDCDLLENVFISNQINESELVEFDRLISEQEMMISLYENQQFLVEQDTQVFMYLRYNNLEVLSEGVLENIGKAIMSILERIKELISKFIGFITGNRKKDNGIEKDEEETANKMNASSKKAEATVSDIIDGLDKVAKKFEQMSDEDWIKEYKSNIKSAEESIDKCNHGKIYIPIYIHKDVMRKVNITDKWSDIENLIDTAEKMIELVKERKNIDEYIDKFKNFVPINGTVRLSNDKNDTRSIYADYENKCDRDTYYKNYYRDAKLFFRNYTQESSKNISYLNNILNKRIKPLEKETKDIIKSMSKNDNYKKTANKLHTIIAGISSSCTSKIQTLTVIEKVYQSFIQNMLTTARSEKIINDNINTINKYEKLIKEKLNQVGN